MGAAAFFVTMTPCALRCTDGWFTGVGGITRGRFVMGPAVMPLVRGEACTERALCGRFIDAEGAGLGACGAPPAALPRLSGVFGAARERLTVGAADEGVAPAAAFTAASPGVFIDVGMGTEGESAVLPGEAAGGRGEVAAAAAAVAAPPGAADFTTVPRGDMGVVAEVMCRAPAAGRAAVPRPRGGREGGRTAAVCGGAIGACGGCCGGGGEGAGDSVSDSCRRDCGREREKGELCCGASPASLSCDEPARGHS